MAASAGKAPAAPKAAKPRPTRWLQGLACGALVTLASPTALLAGVLLAPGLLALMLDPVAGKPTGRPVLLLGLAASAAPIGQLWRLGQSLDLALNLLSDPAVLATAWAAQAAGWLIVELAPLLIGVALEAAAKTHSARLRAARRRYEEDWDMSIAGEEPAEE
jgi:hypothetical protein